MPLGTTNITVSLVKNTLGDSANDVGGLCESQLINKWSLRKPVRDNRLFGIPLEEVGTSDTYGLEPPIWNGGQQIWTYKQPRGGISEPYRLSDFANYEHASLMPIVITDIDGNTYYTKAVSSVAVSGGANVSGGFSVAYTDVLPDYYFAVQLKNSAGTTVWGTSNNVGDILVNINLLSMPFKGSMAWIDSNIEIKCFLSSHYKSFSESEPQGVVKKAIEYHSTECKTTQQITLTNAEFLSVTIDGIRADRTTGTFLPSDGLIDEQNLPTPLITQGSICLKCIIYNNSNSAYVFNGSGFTWGSSKTYNNTENYIDVTGNMYNVSDSLISSVTIPAGGSATFLLYNQNLLDGSVLTDILSPYFKVRRGTTTISSPFNKRCSKL